MISSQGGSCKLKKILANDMTLAEGEMALLFLMRKQVENIGTKG